MKDQKATSVRTLGCHKFVTSKLTRRLGSELGSYENMEWFNRKLESTPSACLTGLSVSIIQRTRTFAGRSELYYTAIVHRQRLRQDGQDYIDRQWISRQKRSVTAVRVSPELAWGRGWHCSLFQTFAIPAFLLSFISSAVPLLSTAPLAPLPRPSP